MGEVRSGQEAPKSVHTGFDSVPMRPVRLCLAGKEGKVDERPW